MARYDIDMKPIVEHRNVPKKEPIRPVSSIPPGPPNETPEERKKRIENWLRSTGQGGAGVAPPPPPAPPPYKPWPHGGPFIRNYEDRWLADPNDEYEENWSGSGKFEEPTHPGPGQVGYTPPIKKPAPPPVVNTPPIIPPIPIPGFNTGKGRGGN